jgi:hypothetical protein
MFVNYVSIDSSIFLGLYRGHTSLSYHTDIARKIALRIRSIDTSTVLLTHVQLT